MKPLAIDLYAGLGGWTEGLLAAGYRVVGFDITRHVYGEQRYPAQLVLQDILTIHGSQFRDAAVIVASPPCQKYSWLAMPWSKSKCPVCKGKKVYYAWQTEVGRAPSHFSNWGDPIPCDCKEQSAKAKALRKEWETNGPDNRLFDACFRIQREAIEARLRSCFRCNPINSRFVPFSGAPCSRCHIPLIVENVRGAQPWVGRSRANYGSFHLWGDVEQVGNRIQVGPDVGRFGAGLRIGTTRAKVPGQNWSRFKETGEVSPHWRMEGVKVASESGRRTDVGKGARFTSRDCGVENGTKIGGDWFSDPNSTCRKHGSKSSARKAASAQIAKIPLALSGYIANAMKPAAAVRAA